MNIGSWVKVKKGEYDIISVDETGKRSYTSEKLELNTSVTGLLIGQVWDGKAKYNVKVSLGKREIGALYIITVEKEDISETESPLNEDGFGW